ncbi:anthranilate phosphoribosyltransferase [Halioglobus japonicus]|uniref:Anthranilate phosphoribosyltransferase n=1 Tax=Halioglobus japonicus TaxID=930805 RepID=A0AAP8MBU6_9GAMM|nr:anthranilate phosphoribosyltransferase [Halioglobus japonicus]AQA17023.1 anthranilate phosphoribosyltransferase [Halioglobus japonicus]PLW84928.1 anthranilate phosphoribosyltransferase [Halioglobus japonicus]GHD18570.1 anthranilate phosphoribosyltransferase [Halioglobus japonicus]
MDIQQAITALVAGENLDREAMAGVMRQVMSGDATDAQIGGLLVALRIKGETTDEIAGAAQVMRELATSVEVDCEHLVDLVGTGGDGANLFNVSTASTFVVAAAGAHVAKHGNRGVSSSSGSSDVLETLGMPLDLSPDQTARAIEEMGLGFMFAPAHHSAMRYAIGPRRELGMRTVFNVLGPLTNPAGVKRQVIGVFAEELCELMAKVSQTLGAEQVMIVHSEDGLDEISIAAPTKVAELRAGSLSTYTIQPEDFGMSRRSLDGLSVQDSRASAQLIRNALSGAESEAADKARDIIALNAGATIYTAGIAATLADGVAMAQDLMASGQANEKLNGFIDFTQLMRGKAN